MDESNRIKLVEIFCEVLDLDSSEVEACRQVDTRKWDSLAMVVMIGAIESEFGIDVKVEEYDRFTSYLGVKLLLEELGL